MFFIPSILVAQEKPTSAEAFKVIQYYVEGKGQGALLVDYKLCSEIGKDGPEKNECVSDFSGNQVKAGEEAMIWMNFLVPTNDEAKIYISFSRNNRIRKTVNFTLPGAFRYRTWKKIPTNAPGNWTIHIFQELENTDIDLGKLNYMVN